MKAKLHIAPFSLFILAALGLLITTASGQAPARPPMVTVELSVVEIQTSKLRTLGFD